jgi:hypothetical protein
VGGFNEIDDEGDERRELSGSGGGMKGLTTADLRRQIGECRVRLQVQPVDRGSEWRTNESASLMVRPGRHRKRWTIEAKWGMV